MVMMYYFSYVLFCCDVCGQDGTTEWVNAAEDSEDAVQLVQHLVIHKGYPAMQFRLNKKAVSFLGVKIPPDST
jgi:hypothetical protein